MQRLLRVLVRPLVLLRKVPGFIRRKVVELAIKRWLRKKGVPEVTVTNFLDGYRTKLAAIGQALGGVVLIINGVVNDFDWKQIAAGWALVTQSLANIGIRYANGAK